MKNLELKEGLKKRIGALTLAVLMMGTPKIAQANTETANAVLDEQEVVYQLEDSRVANLVVNAETIYRNKCINGSIDSEYESMLIDPLFTLDGLNQMRENLINHNINSLFTNPEEFKYISMGIYSDSETDKKILDGVAVLVEQFAKNPTDTATLDRLILIFTGRDREYSTALLSVGGKQALANDVYFVNALVQVYGLDEYTEQFASLATAYGNNGDIITYINALGGKQNCK